MKSNHIFALLAILLFLGACRTKEVKRQVYYPENVLDYSANPLDAKDRNHLAFSDQGAWFAYGFPTVSENYGGFTGPFLMTQENGVWSSPILGQLTLLEVKNNMALDWSKFVAKQESYQSHLYQSFENEQLKVEQRLVYSSAHTAIITSKITNMGARDYAFQPIYSGKTYLTSLHFTEDGDLIKASSDLSPAIGYIQSWSGKLSHQSISDSSFVLMLNSIELSPGESVELVMSQSFIFPEYDWDLEHKMIAEQVKEAKEVLLVRVNQKQEQLQSVYNKLDSTFQKEAFKDLVAKTQLTLQNNWRIPAGELKHSGLFPSYHYKWFHGFWAWDSWKHAVALAKYDTDLAKEQIKAMYDYMDEEGFIADCIYRDTTIEKHNDRNTKAPLSAWAVWKVYEHDGDSRFLIEMYPLLKKQHEWWYKNRDHDQDGLCEYGSTDGSLIAAKWESGMDNAVRFDESQILKNSETAYSLNQESVDLNAYLYAEKGYLSQMARVLNFTEESKNLDEQAELLKTQVQNQFYDPQTAWFYDTSIDGKEFVKVMACEGWIPLWANLATASQAASIKDNMMNKAYFNVKVPLQTLSAAHPKFKPEGGYWRGPVWLDQSYFGIKGLKNYGYHEEALELTQKLIYNADGVFTKGASIRENYQPITGQGLESESFSWSAAHYMLMIMEE